MTTPELFRFLLDIFADVEFVDSVLIQVLHLEMMSWLFERNPRCGENDCCQVGLRGTGWAHGDLGWGRQQVGNIVFQNFVGVIELAEFGTYWPYLRNVE